MGSQAPADPPQDPAPAADPEGDDTELSDLERALEGEAAGDEDPATPGADDTDGAIGSLAELAERVGVEPHELYGVEIPMGGDDAPVTIGDLKDAYAELETGRADREAWEIQKAEDVNQITEARRQLAMLTAQIPEQMRTPAMIERAAAELETVRERQTQQLLERVPEWKDQTRYEADKAVMGEHLGRYGFSSEDLESVVDHRLMAYVRDMALREQRLEKYLEQAKAKRKTKAARRQTQAASPTKQQRRADRSGPRTTTAAVADVLRGNKP